MRTIPWASQGCARWTRSWHPEDGTHRHGIKQRVPLLRSRRSRDSVSGGSPDVRGRTDTHRRMRGAGDVASQVTEHGSRRIPETPIVVDQRRRTTAILAVRDGRNRRFAGCTSFSFGPEHHCGHTERICEKCQQGLMIRLGNRQARCESPSCLHEVPLCRCTVPRPMVERRNRRLGELFWGCQRYETGRSCGTTKRMDRHTEHRVL